MGKSKKRAAHFAPCEECELHGHIVCANGEESREFGTIFKGLEVLEDMLLQKKVTRWEAAGIILQLELSKMVPRDDDEDRMMELLLEERGRTEEGFRDLFEEVHRVIRSGEAGDKKEYLQ